MKRRRNAIDQLSESDETLLSLSDAYISIADRTRRKRSKEFEWI